MPHTPGPWTHLARHPLIPGEIVALNDSRAKHISIAECCGLGPEACANAKLITAAPDLLEAAKVARTVLGTLTMDSKYDNAKNMLQAAIEKAVG